MKALVSVLVLVAALGFGSACMAAETYYVYADWTPGVTYPTGVGGYIDVHGHLGPPGGQYLFFTSGPSYDGPRGAHVGYCFRVETPGDPNRHPSNPADTGPMVPRTFTLVSTHVMTEYPEGQYYAGHTNDFQVDDTGIYYGPSWGGVFHWWFDWTPLGWVVQDPLVSQTFARNPITGDWWTADSARSLFKWDGVAWAYQFTHVNLAGDHSDGLEIIGSSMFVSDMTSDLIIQYRMDAAGNVIDPPGAPYKTFTYSNPASVEGMGYGPNQHLWIAGWSSGTIYELGGGTIQGWLNQIPDQSILEGQQFTQFDLDDYSGGQPPITYSWAGAVHLTITVDVNHVVRITYPAGWVGSETVTLTVRDGTGWTQPTQIAFEVLARAILINYQGKLTDTLGRPVDAVQPITFRIYDSSGANLWQETQTVAVQKGIFHVLLGSQTVIPDTLFNEPVRYLGVTVGGAELTPRQRIACVAYAAHALNTDKVGGFEAGDFVKRSGDMMTGSLDVRGSFRAGTHSLVYDDMTGFVGIGTEAPTYPLEVMGTVKADAFIGSGVGLTGVDADTLDGAHASGFARTGHDHWGESWSGKGTGLTLTTQSGGAIVGITTDASERGPYAGYFEGPSHWGGGVKSVSLRGTGVYGEHNDPEYTSPGIYGNNRGSGAGVLGRAVSGPGGQFSSTSGPAVQADGDVRADRVAYNSPRTHYFTVGGEAFVPGSNVNYQNTYGMGGAYIASGSGALVAAVHLPHGATVTSFKVYFNDTSAADMDVWLARLSLAAGGYAILAEVLSSGAGGYMNVTDNTIGSVIDNTAFGYHVYAFSTNWSSSLRIMGAVITYTIDEAP